MRNFRLMICNFRLGISNLRFQISNFKFQISDFRFRIFNLSLLVILLALWSLPVLGEADRSTQDALNEIDASALPATLPAHEVVSKEPGNSHLSLLALFAPMLAAGAAVGMAGGVAGTFVLLRREALIALALPQVVAAGAALGLREGWPTLPPSLAAAMAAVMFLVISRRRGSGPWVLPALYVAGLSISFLLIASKGQDVADLQKLFTGIDVAVTPIDAYVAVPILLLVSAVLALLWRRWLLMAQAPAAAELAGLHPARWDALFLVLLAAVLLLGTNVLGVVMVLAMLFLPPAAALPWVRSVPMAMGVSAALGVVFLAIGFVLSNAMQWPLSQSIGGVGFGVVAASHLVALARSS